MIKNSTSSYIIPSEKPRTWHQAHCRISVQAKLFNLLEDLYMNLYSKITVIYKPTTQTFLSSFLLPHIRYFERVNFKICTCPVTENQPEAS